MGTDNRCYIRIGQLRKERGKTIAELSSDISISASAISNYERGLRSPDSDTLIKLAKYFDCTTDYLLGLSDIQGKEQLNIKKNILLQIFEEHANIKVNNNHLLESFVLVLQNLALVDVDLPETIDYFDSLLQEYGSILRGYALFSSYQGVRETDYIFFLHDYEQAMKLLTRTRDLIINRAKDNVNGATIKKWFGLDIDEKLSQKDGDDNAET